MSAKVRLQDEQWFAKVGAGDSPRPVPTELVLLTRELVKHRPDWEYVLVAPGAMRIEECGEDLGGVALKRRTVPNTCTWEWAYELQVERARRRRASGSYPSTTHVGKAVSILLEHCRRATAQEKARELMREASGWMRGTAALCAHQDHAARCMVWDRVFAVLYDNEQFRQAVIATDPTMTDKMNRWMEAHKGMLHIAAIRDAYDARRGAVVRPEGDDWFVCYLATGVSETRPLHLLPDWVRAGLAMLKLAGTNKLVPGVGFYMVQGDYFIAEPRHEA
ncbi:MAG: hypothetical protein ACK4WM_04870 [Thermoflexales bacterium]